MYLFGSVQEVARTRDVSGRVAPDPEGGLETKTHSHSQGNVSACADIFFFFYIEVSLILNNLCFVFLFFLQEGSITHVACCPHDEDFIAVATRLEINLNYINFKLLFLPLSICLFSV